MRGTRSADGKDSFRPVPLSPEPHLKRSTCWRPSPSSGIVRASARQRGATMPIRLDARVPRFSLALLLFTLVLTPARGDVDAGKLAQIRARMQAFVDQHDVAGVVTVVGRSTGIVSHEAVGNLNLEKGQPMPIDGLFRIASMTKPITAIGIMMLVDEGKLTVDDPVEKHLPEFRG